MAVAVGAVTVAAAATPVTAVPGGDWEALRADLDAVVEEAATAGVTLSVSVTDLAGGDDGTTVQSGEDARLKAASIIKLALLATLMADVDAGELSLDQVVTIPAGDPNIVGGSGTLRDRTFPLDITVRELAELMVQVSDNTATNVLIDVAGGFDAVNDHVRDLGLEDLHLGRKMIHPASPPLGENYITAAETTELIALIWHGQILSPTSSEYIVDLMRGQLVDTKYGAVIPRPHLANKTGELADVSHDAGIILLPGREIALTTTTSFGSIPRAEADAFVQETAQVVYDFARITGDTTADLTAIVEPYIAQAAENGIRVAVGYSDLTAEDGRLLLGSPEPYNPASVIKLSLLATVMRQAERGLLDLDAPITISPYMVVGGSGTLQNEEMPFTTTVREVARRMVVVSDNTATNVLLYYTGIPTTQALLDDLGLEVMRFNRQMFPGDLIDSPPNVIDAADTLTLLEEMYRGDLLTTASRDQILTWMSQQEVDTKFGAVLGDKPIAHKTGETGNVTHDTGYFLVPGHESAVVVLTEVTDSPSFEETQRIGNPVVQDIGLAIYDYLDALPDADGPTVPEEPSEEPSEQPTTVVPTAGPTGAPSGEPTAPGTDPTTPGTPSTTSPGSPAPGAPGPGAGGTGGTGGSGSTLPSTGVPVAAAAVPALLLAAAGALAARRRQTASR
ncbi:serine hydrolase [Georgenia faecalis]|uniref:Serine hydrolase n=1 Tax=Georgenia faecalis TaxID=2483799 RepID=A0ABV9DBH3_9MICO|nr:serine hydrolase [Georgenia faecalis]